MSDGLENALSVRWAFGFRHGVKNGVQNLTTGDRSAIFFLSSHSGRCRVPWFDCCSPSLIRRCRHMYAHRGHLRF